MLEVTKRTCKDGSVKGAEVAAKETNDLYKLTEPLVSVTSQIDHRRMEMEEASSQALVKLSMVVAQIVKPPSKSIQRVMNGGNKNEIRVLLDL
ncbi:hypothetical protein N7492_004408 [Penicillium capsulatum]|uniref:Uncharacterized protein n=1 Tax=Penicillium capsulatum TaxID=69766 RepID=A0A9W9IAE3_9EURO|nr:hypothetical protein N7492_004408 [Penicillium capsulatum]KAJ6136471.1 hypothetical protein N7512_001631 [Penicillium capsulatum]